MPTYEYDCTACGLRFERRQSITEDPVTECPECRGRVQRRITGGSGFFFKGSEHTRTKQRGECALDRVGRTCCGRDERCGNPPCGDE